VGKAPPPLPRLPGVQLNSLPTYRRALLSERLEQATNKHVNGSLGERASLPLILPSSLPIFSRFLAFFFLYYQVSNKYSFQRITNK